VIADRAYDHDKYRRELCRRGVKPVIARRCTDHGSGLGRVCWVVERTFAWLRNFRRLRIRWERDAGLHYALLSLGCSRDLLAPHPIVRHGRGRCSYAWWLLRNVAARGVSAETWAIGVMKSDRVVRRGGGRQAAAGALVCRQSLRRLWAALMRRHSDLAADLPRRKKRSMRRLNLVSAKIGSIIVWRLA
jgi:hypothetical protein